MEIGRAGERQVDAALPTSLAAVDDPQLTTKSVHRLKATDSHRVCKRRDSQTTRIAWVGPRFLVQNVWPRCKWASVPRHILAPFLVFCNGLQ